MRNYFSFFIFLFISCNRPASDTIAANKNDSYSLVKNNSSEKITEIKKITATDSILVFSTDSFPDSWDTKRELRGEDGKVLTWIHGINDAGNEWKSCLLLQVKDDYRGHVEYSIMQKNSHQSPFDEWNIGFIDYAPDSVSKFGFNDLLVRTYEHVPTKKEIYKLFNEFHFEFQSNTYLTLEAGLDKKLWMNSFGFIPQKYLPQKEK
jgi:hypothetical protein